MVLASSFGVIFCLFLTFHHATDRFFCGIWDLILSWDLILRVFWTTGLAAGRRPGGPAAGRHYYYYHYYYCYYYYYYYY